jgi:antitoxin VapB
LFAAIWACSPQSRRIHGRTNLSAAKQPYPGQNKIIHGKTSLSTPNQPYPAQTKFVCHKVDLFAAKSGDIAVNKVILRQAGPTAGPPGWDLNGILAVQVFGTSRSERRQLFGQDLAVDAARRGTRVSIGPDIGRSDGREDAVQAERIVRLFRNGRNQALRIPRDLELPGNEALLHKEGNRLIVEPVRRPSVLDLLASWEPLDEDFPEIEDPPPVDDVDL